MIYLDNAATTRMSSEVLEEMIPFLTDRYGNAGSFHSFGREAASAVQRAREQVAELINCEPNQIVFTSGGSESNAMVFSGIRNHLLRKGKTGVVISNVEHDSVDKAARSMGKCFNLSKIPVNRFGRVPIGEIDNYINDNTGLVSIMSVNNETGAVNPLASIGKVCGYRDVLFHTDCVQAIGSYKTDVSKIGCDFLSLSGHKIHAPKGTGALYIKDKKLLRPRIRGGDTQEDGLRGGTANVAGIVGLGKACELANARLHEDSNRITELKDCFIKRLWANLIRYDIEELMCVNGSPEHGKILNLRFKGIDGQTLLLMLDAEGVCVSAGSACHSDSTEPSRVLLAMGLTDREARESIRVSFSALLSKDDVISAADIMGECINLLATGDIVI